MRYEVLLPVKHNNDQNYSNNESCYSFDELHQHLASKIFFIVLYSSIMMTALAGNSLVLYVVATNRAMQTVTNLFITNLAASDLVVNLTSLWVTPVYTYLNRWVWGEHLCHTVPLFQGMSIFISSLTLTAIAVERFTVIVHPYHKRISARFCITTVAFIWLLSLMLVAPYAMHMKLDYKAECDTYVCREEWAFEQIQIVYSFVVLALQFVVPFIVISVCYTRIWRHLIRSQKRAGLRSDVSIHRKRRRFKMLVGMLLIFALCWLPPNIINIVKDSGLSDANYFVFIFLIGHAISMSSSMWNPLLYALLNDNFRREFVAILSCCRSSTQERLRHAYSFSKKHNAAKLHAAHTAVHYSTRLLANQEFRLNKNVEKDDVGINGIHDRILNGNDTSTNQYFDGKS